MPMSTRLTDAFARIGQEFKSVRSAIAQKYTKPSTGIPLEDLSSVVHATFVDTTELNAKIQLVTNFPTSPVTGVLYLKAE